MTHQDISPAQPLRQACFNTIRQRLPEWLPASAHQHGDALRGTGVEVLEQVNKAAARLPEVMQGMQAEYQRHQALESRVKDWLAGVQYPAVFAEPLLIAALRDELGLAVDVRTTFFFHARRVLTSDTFVTASSDWLKESVKAFTVAARPLLSAAMQNFEAWECEAGAMDLPRKQSRLYASTDPNGEWQGESLNVPPEQFAALCRRLDLGGRYQRRVAETFDPPVVDEPSGTRRQIFQQYEQSGFLLELHLARFQERVSPTMYQALYRLAHGREAAVNGSPVTCAFLTLEQVELRAIVLFGHGLDGGSASGPIVAYIPGDPEAALHSWDSLSAFHAGLRDRLRKPAYRGFFQQFFPARQRARLLEKIQAALYPERWNPGGWYERVEDPAASLPLHCTPCVGPLIPGLLQQKIDGLKDDGLFMLVPTAEKDHKTLTDKFYYFAQEGLVALNVAGFVVPVIGTAMLVFTVAQLGYEVYEGIGEWLRGEREAAWGYLLDVVGNVALMGALAAAGTVARVEAQPLPAVPARLRPVRMPDGSESIWAADLKPYAHEVELPPTLRPDAAGLYAYAGKRWLRRDGQLFSVMTRDDGTAFLEHPRRANAYQPAVRDNGDGVWLHELDQPLHWSGMTLVLRLGPLAEGLDAAMFREVLTISGLNESVVRRALAEGRRLPALLVDSLERYRLHRAALPLYDLQQGVPQADGVATLEQTFPGLSWRMAGELAEHATAAERARIAAGRVPRRIAEEARCYLRQARLALAYEGVYRQAGSNADTERLLLHSLAQHPGWNRRLRLEVRALLPGGPLLDAVGPVKASDRRVLVKSIVGYRLGNVTVQPSPVDFYRAVLDVLTPAEREALGVGGAAQGDVLRAWVAGHPLERPALRRVLGLQAPPTWWRSPMRLADGRVGYPLSGRPRPLAADGESALLEKISRLDLPNVFPHDLLRQLTDAGMDHQAIDVRLQMLLEEQAQLREALNLDSAERLPDTFPQVGDRQLIEFALWQHWYDNLLPEIGRTGVPLRLYAVSLRGFSQPLPAFFLNRVRALELDMVFAESPRWSTSAQGEVVHEDVLASVLRRFPRLSTLNIETLAGRSSQGLMRTVVDAAPQLEHLRMANTGLTVGQELLAQTRRLRGLRYLDLSGNRISHLPVTDNSGLRLDYLGLDHLDLEQWPDWLDESMLDGIGHLSLNDNRLVQLPLFLRVNAIVTHRHTRISVKGNPFSHQSMINIRASEWHGRRFSFDLDLPASVQASVESLMREREQLNEALQQWVSSNRRGGRAGDERVAARESLTAALVNSWTAQPDGFSGLTLTLEALDLDDFPPSLPDFFFARVSRLELLNPRGAAEQLDIILLRFHRLEAFSLSGYHLPHLPSALPQLAALKHLALVDADLTVDQACIDRLGGMRRLTTLELDGNRLGAIDNVAAWSGLFFSRLSLERMDIAQWPAWIDPLLPDQVQWLSLNHNRLRELPRYLLQNRHRSTGNTDVSLEGNPLTHETLLSAHLSEGLDRPYSFRLDLPDDIRRLGQAQFSSASEGGSVTETSDDEEALVTYWLEPGSDTRDRRQRLWERIARSGDAGNLLRLVGRLRHAADYRSRTARPDLMERVWRVLAAAADDTALRLTLNGMAEEPLHQLKTFDTCPDGIRLEFNQMEIQVFTSQALREIPPARRGQALYQLMRRLYRLQELDAIAREQAGPRDEAEVRLAYRLQLAGELNLPLVPEHMLYAGAAGLRSGELVQVAAWVREREAGAGLLKYAVQRDFWLAYLREHYAEQFEAIKSAFEAKVLGLSEEYPDQTPAQMAERIRTLMTERLGDDKRLIEALTRQAREAD